LSRAIDGEQQTIAIERLRDVVVGAGAHRGDGGLELALGGHHDDRQVGVASAQVLNHLESTHLAEPESTQATAAPSPSPKRALSPESCSTTRYPACSSHARISRRAVGSSSTTITSWSPPTGGAA